MPIKDQSSATSNGAMIAVRGGKSVLLKHLIGLMQPDAGEIWVSGKNIIGMSERQLTAIRQKVGILFQSGALFDSMTVEDNIAFPLREAGMRDVKAMRARVNEVLEVVELEGENAKMPESLSGGMRKRVGLARAIIRRPSCVLYDEPTSGLDPVVSDSINLKSAVHVGDRIAYLHEGRVYFQGTPAELKQCDDPIIQDFLLGRSESATH